MRIWNLRKRLALVLLLSMLPAAILIGANAYNEIRQIKRSSGQDLQQMLDSTEIELRHAVDDVRRLLEVFAHLSVEHAADSSECANIFADLLAANPKLTNILISSPTGVVTCSARPSPPTINLADRDYLQEAIDSRGFVVGNFITGRITHKPVLPIALPLLGDELSVQAIIIAAIDANWLGRRMLQQRFSGAVEALLLDENLKVIASSSRPERIGTSIQGSLLGEKLDETGSGIMEAIDLDGEESLLGIQRLQFSPGHTTYLVMTRTLSSLEGRVLYELLVNLLALVVVIGLAGLLVWPLAYKFFIANMNRLVQQAQQLSLGALDTRSSPALLESDLKPVAKALDTMADAIQRKEQLEAAAHAEICRREAQLKSFLDNSAGVAFMVDLEGRLLLANQTFRRLLLPDTVDLPAFPYYQLLPAPIAKSVRELDLRTIESGTSVTVDMKFSPDAAAATYLCNRFPLLNSDGKPYALGIIASDISEREKLERELQITCGKLERSNQDLQDFAYISSHDLQEPLRKIEAFSGRLMSHCQQQLDEKSADYLERIQNAAHRMRGLIDSLLTYSRLTTKPQPMETVDLRLLVDAILKDLEVRIEQTQAQIEVGPLPCLQADPLQMRQLLQNLIANAMKFHKPGVAPKVSIAARPSQQVSAVNGSQMIELVVSDEGIGFDEKYVGKIFAPFQRLHGRSEYEGTGMGLAIVQKVVDRHGGQIKAISRPHEGATFVVTLPTVSTQSNAA